MTVAVHTGTKGSWQPHIDRRHRLSECRDCQRPWYGLHTPEALVVSSYKYLGALQACTQTEPSSHDLITTERCIDTRRLLSRHLASNKRSRVTKTDTCKGLSPSSSGRFSGCGIQVSKHRQDLSKRRPGLRDAALWVKQTGDQFRRQPVRLPQHHNPMQIHG